MQYYLYSIIEIMTAELFTVLTKLSLSIRTQQKFHLSICSMFWINNLPPHVMQSCIMHSQQQTSDQEIVQV